MATDIGISTITLGVQGPILNPSSESRDVGKTRSTGRRPPRACEDLEEVICHEELSEFNTSPRKQRTNEVI